MYLTGFRKRDPFPGPPGLLIAGVGLPPGFDIHVTPLETTGIGQNPPLMGLLFALLPAIRVATGLLSGPLARIWAKIPAAEGTVLLRFIQELSTGEIAKGPGIKSKNKTHHSFI